MGLRVGFMLHRNLNKHKNRVSNRSKENYEEENGLVYGPKGNHQLEYKPQKISNLNELLVTISTTLDPTKHIVMVSVSSMLKAKRTSNKQKANKHQQKFHPKLEALLERLENDDDFDASLSDIDEYLRY